MKSDFLKKIGMPLERYQSLKKIIRFDSEWLERYLNAKFKDSWNPGKIYTVDETLFPFKGKWVGIQHIRGNLMPRELNCISLVMNHATICHFGFIKEKKKQQGMRRLMALS